MGWVLLFDYMSIAAGVVSAACWVKSAIVKVDPPQGLEGLPDGEYMDGTILNGGEMIGTLRAQARWNSIAAFAAAAAVSLQVLAKLV
ncbi:hypothetical protein [Pseudomonas asiatica]|uniref:hypothetical protein n=1 Tax=Pseudomonas asiatica TaxID=2219225 RepID=UPI003877A70D